MKFSWSYNCAVIELLPRFTITYFKGIGGFPILITLQWLTFAIWLRSWGPSKGGF